MSLNAPLWSFFAVGIGAALGAWARWGLSLWLNARHAQFPLGTFAANAIGGLLVGIALLWSMKQPDVSPAWRLLIITGFLGGLTTFSTFSAEVVALLMRGQFGWGALLAASHLLVSLLLTAVGVWVGRAMWGM